MQFQKALAVLPGNIRVEPQTAQHVEGCIKAVDSRIKVIVPDYFKTITSKCAGYGTLDR